jgi:hypothetical protein
MAKQMQKRKENKDLHDKFGEISKEEIQDITTLANGSVEN